jgi:Zn-dependent protease with chaperone function
LKFVPRGLGGAADNSKGGKEGWRSRLKGILSAVIILSVLYLVLGFVADMSANLVPEETESEWFAWVDDVLLADAQAPPPELQAVLDKLITGSDLRPFDYRLCVLVDPTPNAFALPGGTITVTTGLLDMVKSDIGRAMVIGHELGHLEYRHGLKRLGRSLLLAVGMSMVGLDSNALLKQSSFLAEMKHSRSQEEESDSFGLNLVYSKYGTTEGAFEFFEEVHLLQGADEASLIESVQSWAHTHPLTENRLTNLKRQAIELAR